MFSSFARLNSILYFVHPVSRDAGFFLKVDEEYIAEATMKPSHFGKLKIDNYFYYLLGVFRINYR